MDVGMRRRGCESRWVGGRIRRRRTRLESEIQIVFLFNLDRFKEDYLLNSFKNNDNLGPINCRCNALQSDLCAPFSLYLSPPSFSFYLSICWHCTTKSVGINFSSLVSPVQCSKSVRHNQSSSAAALVCQIDRVVCADAF